MSGREKQMKYTLRRVLEEKCKKNIVFYGVSQERYQITEEEKKKFNIFFMDLDSAISAAEDVNLRSLEQALEKQIDSFVVMRQMITVQATFFRLLEYSRKYGADIYDEEGRDVGAVCIDAVKAKRGNKEEIQKEINTHECISFDIFETLLVRKVLFPEDVFDLTEKHLNNRGIEIENFAQKRRESQSELGLTNPDINDIYKRFGEKYGLPDDIIGQCRDIELELERVVLTPRKDMVKIFYQCLEAGKRVNLVSDMYIPQNILVGLLEENGIRGYENIYISCEKRKLKLQGLFKIYKQETKGKKYLHIGDNIIHDGICAKLEGIDYCLITSPYEMAKTTKYQSALKAVKSLEERIILGISISKVLNSPFAITREENKISVKSDYDFAYGFCAPILCQFASWLYSEIEKEGYDNILFAARDGYLIKKMYEILRKREKDNNIVAPEGKYFYISRKAAVMTCVNNETYFNMLIYMQPKLEPEKLLEERFNLSKDQILPFNPEKYDDIHKYVCAHIKPIFRRTDEARYNYYKYMKSIDLEIGGKYAFMDFVSSGTSQRALAKIAPFKIQGFYVGWSGSDSEEELGVKALYNDISSFFLKHYKIIETFMSSEEPSLNYFNENGNPVFQDQERNEDELLYVKEMQKACTDFLLDFLDIVDNKVENVSNGLLDSIFSVSDVVKLEKGCILNHITLMDDWVQVRLKKESIF